MEQYSVKEVKKILFTIDNFKSSIKEFHEDGITLAYDYTSENFVKDAINKVIIVRNPNASDVSLNNKSVEPKKRKNNALVLTAIALLPEIISVLKD